MSNQKRHVIRSTDILSGFVPMEIDYEKRRADSEKRYELLLKEYEAKMEAEKSRFENLSCPVCKSKDKKIESQSTSNGVFGPGYHSSILFEHIVCQACGILYKDLSKPGKIEYPKKDYLY